MIRRDDAEDVARRELLDEIFDGDEVPRQLQQRLLRTREVARAFQVSERTVNDWAKRGRIPSVRMPGGTYLFPADDVRTALRGTCWWEKP